MLDAVAEGVLVHRSAFCQTNTVVVDGREGVLVVDPGVLVDELTGLAGDLHRTGRPVAAGFSTHPHWDHLLWHPALGSAPRYATARGAEAVQAVLTDPEWAARIAPMIPPDIAAGVPLDLFGLTTGLPPGAEAIPWNGPRVRIVEHRAHAAGHAALLVEERGALVAGDTLSDVLVPILDLRAEDPIADYLGALDLLVEVAADVETVIPGHGSVGGAGAVRERVDRDRAYLLALRDGARPDDPRLGPDAVYDWVAGVHERQAQHLAQR